MHAPRRIIILYLSAPLAWGCAAQQAAKETAAAALVSAPDIFAALDHVGGSNLQAAALAAQDLNLRQVSRLIGSLVSGRPSPAALITSTRLWSAGSVDLQHLDQATFLQGIAGLNRGPEAVGGQTTAAEVTASTALVAFAVFDSYAQALSSKPVVGLGLADSGDSCDPDEVQTAIKLWSQANAGAATGDGKQELNYQADPKKEAGVSFDIKTKHLLPGDSKVGDAGDVVGMDYRTLNPLPQCVTDAVSAQAVEGKAGLSSIQQTVVRLATLGLENAASEATQ